MPYNLIMLSISLDDKDAMRLVGEVATNGITFTSTRNPRKHNTAMRLYSNGLLKLVHTCGDEHAFTPTDKEHGNEIYVAFRRGGGVMTEGYWNRVSVWQVYRYDAMRGTSLLSWITKQGGIEQAFSNLWADRLG